MPYQAHCGNEITGNFYLWKGSSFCCDWMCRKVAAPVLLLFFVATFFDSLIECRYLAWWLFCSNGSIAVYSTCSSESPLLLPDDNILLHCITYDLLPWCDSLVLERVPFSFRRGGTWSPLFTGLPSEIRRFLRFQLVLLDLDLGFFLRRELAWPRCLRFGPVFTTSRASMI